MSLLDFFPSHFLFGAVLGIFNLTDNKSRLCFLAPWAGRSPYRLEAAAVLPQIKIVIQSGEKGDGIAQTMAASTHILLALCTSSLGAEDLLHIAASTLSPSSEA